VTALEALRKNRNDAAAKRFEQHKADLGFGLLLKKYTTDVRHATPEMIDRACTAPCPR
jgi:cytochrome d ubiquinol oxidase subunit I